MPNIQEYFPANSDTSISCKSIMPLICIILIYHSLIYFSFTPHICHARQNETRSDYEAGTGNVGDMKTKSWTDAEGNRMTQAETAKQHTKNTQYDTVYPIQPEIYLPIIPQHSHNAAGKGY